MNFRLWASISALLVCAACRKEAAWVPRRVEGRVSGYPYGPWRGPAKNRAEDAAAVRLVTSMLAPNPRVTGAHYRGIVDLVSGNPDHAVAQLEAATLHDANDARAWSDLAAARREASRRDDDTELLLRGLLAADRALALEKRSAAALFNRALILDAIGLRATAVSCWKTYLSVDSGSVWSDEARRRVDLDRRSTGADAWRAQARALMKAAERSDANAVNTIVAAYPEEVRRSAEVEYLFQWATLSLAHDPAAATWLRLARLAGDALRRQLGEALLSGAVRAIDRGDKRVLANAHTAYYRGRFLYSQRHVAEAVPLLRQAAAQFRVGGSPMEFVANYYLANAALDADDPQRTCTMLDALPSRSEYPALRANVLGTRGTALARLGNLSAALKALRDSAAMFDALKEPRNATRVRVSLAALQARLGQTHEAWITRRETFRRADETGDMQILEFALDAALRGEIREQRFDTASALVTVQVELTQSSPRLHFDALLWQAYLSARTVSDGAIDADALRRAAQRIPDRALRDDALDEVRFAEALVICPRDARRARELLDQSVAFRLGRGARLRVPEVLVERAVALRALGERDLAVADLKSAVRIIDEHRETIDVDDLRDSFLGATSRAFRDLADLLSARGDDAAAFDVVERARARTMAERMGRLVAAQAGSQPAAGTLPQGAILAEFLPLPDRLVVFVFTDKGMHAQTIGRSSASLQDLADRFAGATSRDDRMAAASLARDLYDILITPVVSAAPSAATLVLVPDAITESIPFAALVDRTTGAYLVEQRAIIVAPSANTYLRATALAALRPHAQPQVLLVGDPAFPSNELTRRLPRLAGASAEVHVIEGVYRATSTLTGAEATKQRVLSALGDRDLLHLATHAIVNDRVPSLSAVVLAGTKDEDGLLTAAEIARLSLRRAPLVVLAGCRTGSLTAGNGSVRSLAAAFLFAGARSSVATLWNVDDETTRYVSVSLHEWLRAGLPVAEALRRAQVHLIQEERAGRGSPRVWSAFEVYGAGQ